MISVLKKINFSVYYTSLPLRLHCCTDVLISKAIMHGVVTVALIASNEMYTILLTK